MALRWAVVTYEVPSAWETYTVPVPDDVDDAEAWMHDHLGTLWMESGAELQDSGGDMMEPTDWQITYGQEKGQLKLL